MKALWLEDQQLRLREDLPKPRPGKGQARIRSLLAGICSTDLELLKGYYPFTGVLGHEFVGEVDHCPEAPHLEGQRVVGEINISCGSCISCRAGRAKHCRQRRTLGIHEWNGAFAEYFLLPINNLYPVPDAVSNQEAVFAEPLAAALEIQEQVNVRPGDQVLVVGAGRLGQLIAQTLALTGCALKVSARHPKQQQILRSRGIEVVSENQLPEGTQDLVIDAAGTPSGFSAARQAVRERGIMVLKSTYAGDLEMDASSLVVDEITLIGSRCGPFPPALRLLEGKLVDPTALIESAYPLMAWQRAIDHAADQGVLKVIFKIA